ncbi:MAG TPA: helix-turn-helix transcriptional regulator [Petrimonas sp.]|uniref:AraC family transcriptional regulator n=1 Tax=Petrimonas sp. TaxID=2023866 RepID=UPI001766F471|nr:helix-turn-helix transcriptional regulator [Petrimonas sp.]
MTNLMHEQLNFSTGSPVKIKWCDYDYFKFPLHFHSEYEIIYIINSFGKRFVGNSIESYSDGDLVLLGSYLPHMYKSAPDFHQNNSNLRVKAIVLQFSNNFFCCAIENYPEFNKIKKLLDESRYGIVFKDCKEADLIKKRLKKALNLKNIDLLIECIKILSLMSDTEKKELLNEDYFENSFDSQFNDPRIIKILTFINNHYSEPINLEDIADKAGMNKSAFCRFFKEKTSKSCIEYINELKVTYACKLLREGKLSISQICYEVGFNNISNFNRQFKKITNFTPSDYLLEFKKAR